MVEPTPVSEEENLEILMKLANLTTYSIHAATSVFIQDLMIEGITPEPEDLMGLKLDVVRFDGGELYEDEEIFLALEPNRLAGLLAALLEIQNILIETGKAEATSVYDVSVNRVEPEDL